MSEEQVERNQEMKELREKMYWTLQMIGDKYHVTRERVRQILGTGSLPEKGGSSQSYSKFHQVGLRPDLTNQEMSKLLGCNINTVARYRHGYRHALSDGCVKIGAHWEDWASQKLTEHGVPNETMPFKYPYDILAYERVRIEVSACLKPRKAPSLKNVSSQWAFRVRKKSHPDICDFYFLIIVPQLNVFIIPSEKMSPLDTLYFCYPTMRPRLFKWGKYLNAYHLILDSHKIGDTIVTSLGGE